MSFAKKLMVGVMLCVLAIGFTGCAKKAAPEVKLVPKVAPPVVSTAGTLKVGVNLGSAPYAVKQNDEVVGLDATLGAALASKLGLKVEYVAVAPDVAAEALTSKQVDIMMSVDGENPDVLVAGEYGTMGAGLYATSAPAAPLEGVSITTFPVAVQEGSPAHWWLLHKFGTDGVKVFPSVDLAIKAVESGEVGLLAADQAVVAYAVVGGSKLVTAGALEAPVARTVAVSPENVDLAQAVKQQINGLSESGVLASVSRKWLGAAVSK